MTRLRMRKIYMVLLCFTLCAMALLCAVSEATIATTTVQTEPMILLYNPLFNMTDWFSNWTNGSESKVTFQLQNCLTVCQFTSDRYFQRFADLVLVSVSGYSGWGGRRPNRTYAKEGQLWTAYQYDPPPHPWGQGYEPVDDQFDWVATYRRDSDIFVPLGRFDPIPQENPIMSMDDIRRSLRGKKLAAWVVSQCGVFVDAKARELLVQTLKRFIPIDVFGRCSGRQCPEQPNFPCRAYLGQNYKFYLAFENSLCQDYVTEKFFQSFAYGNVPVVFGWADYAHIAPPGSYVNALDFDSVEALAKYLIYLDQNEDEYLKYFSWREQFTVRPLTTNEHLCTICEKLTHHLNRTKAVPVVGESGRAEQRQRQLQRTKYTSYQKWHNSFPVGSLQSAPFRIGRRIAFNSEKVCVKYDEYPDFHRWLLGE